jgi:hypothetical protein
MDEVVDLVAKRVGVSEDVARQAVNVVLGYLKGKLPQPVGSRIEDVLLTGESIDDVSDLVGDLGGGLGGLLGRK